MTRQLLRIVQTGLCWSLLLVAWPAFADQVIMHNGDRLTGTLIRLEKGVVMLKSSYSESLELAKDKVDGIETDQPVTVRLDNGEVLTGIMQLEHGVLRIDSSAPRGATTLDWSRIATVNVPPPPPWEWSGKLFAGGNHHSGNTDRASLSLGIDALRKSANDRYLLTFLYNYSQENGHLTSRDYFGAVKYDYFFTRKVYGYLVVELLKDQFKDLNLRAVAGPGVGYQVLDDNDISLSCDAGVSYFSEDRMTGEDDQWLSARLGARFLFRLLETLEFVDNLTIFPNLETGGEYTARNEALLITTIAGPWSLRLSNIWEYASDPGPGVEKSDFKTGANLQYAF